MLPAMKGQDCKKTYAGHSVVAWFTVAIFAV